MVEPIGKRGIEINDVAVRLCREKPCGRMIEIVYGVLQFLEHVLMALKLAGHVCEPPNGHARLPLPRAERSTPYSHPPPLPAFMRADTHLFRSTATFAGRFQQPVDRL